MCKKRMVIPLEMKRASMKPSGDTSRLAELADFYRRSSTSGKWLWCCITIDVEYSTSTGTDVFLMCHDLVSEVSERAVKYYTQLWDKYIQQIRIDSYVSESNCTTYWFYKGIGTAALTFKPNAIIGKI